MTRPPNATSVLVEVAGRFARLVSRTGVEDYQDGTGSRHPIPGDGAHRPGKLVRDEVHARNNARKATGNAKWSGLLIEGAIEAHASDDPDELRNALLDTAALAVAWIHALDHRGTPDDDEPDAVVSAEPRSQLLELLDEVTVAHTAHMLARLDVGKARRAGLNDALDEALAKAEQASYAVTAAELRARAAVVRHLPVEAPIDDRVTIRVPSVPYPGPERTDAHYYRQAAWNLRNGYEVGGSNVTATVVAALDAIATALDGEGPRPDGGR